MWKFLITIFLLVRLYEEPSTWCVNAPVHAFRLLNVREVLIIAKDLKDLLEEEATRITEESITIAFTDRCRVALCFVIVRERGGPGVVRLSRIAEGANRGNKITSPVAIVMGFPLNATEPLFDLDYTGPTNASSVGAELNLPYTVCEILVAICAVFGNGLVIIVFRKERKLRRRTNYYIVSLATADLLVGLFAIPFAILASIGLPTNLHACLFTVSVLVVLCTISIFCLVAVSIDRYWAILYPMGYSRTVRTKTAIGEPISTLLKHRSSLSLPYSLILTPDINRSYCKINDNPSALNRGRSSAKTREERQKLDRDVTITQLDELISRNFFPVISREMSLYSSVIEIVNNSN